MTLDKIDMKLQKRGFYKAKDDWYSTVYIKRTLLGFRFVSKIVELTAIPSETDFFVTVKIRDEDLSDEDKNNASNLSSTDVRLFVKKMKILERRSRKEGCL